MDDYVPSDDGTIDYTNFEVTLCHSTLADSGVDSATYIETIIVPNYDAEAASLNDAYADSEDSSSDSDSSSSDSDSYSYNNQVNT